MVDRSLLWCYFIQYDVQDIFILWRLRQVQRDTQWTRFHTSLTDSMKTRCRIIAFGCGYLNIIHNTTELILQDAINTSIKITQQTELNSATNDQEIISRKETINIYLQ